MGRTPSLVERLMLHAETAPQSCAIAGSNGSVSYAELAERVTLQAQRLRSAGVSEASVVGIVCQDDTLHLVLCLALAQLGATSCTLPSYESAEQHRKFLGKALLTTVVDGSGGVEHVASNDAARADQVLNGSPGAKLLFSTSGTTGEPKVVCHRDAGLVAQAHRHVERSERFACLASLEYNFVKRHRLYCVATGATNVLLDATPEALVAQCQARELSTLHLSAYQARELLGARGVDALRGLRLKLGGSHVPTALRELLRQQVTENLQCGYGTTETGAIAFTDPRDVHAAESVGRALPGIELRVSAAQGAPVQAGERGELAIRCEGLFTGYVGQPRLTAERLVDGWFLTGDVGRLDEQQRIHLGGRADDMFVFNSINIHPQDIEAQILEHPSVVDALVLPQPSPVHGDVPVALVVFKPAGAADLGELKSFVRAKTGVRCPKLFTVVERIPRNSAGKALRDEARALLRAPRSS
jgi:acyl-coenzyme A synthetase/AMP-(fatty) acid ligase